MCRGVSLPLLLPSSPGSGLPVPYPQRPPSSTHNPPLCCPLPPLWPHPATRGFNLNPCAPPPPSLHPRSSSLRSFPACALPPPTKLALLGAASSLSWNPYIQLLPQSLVPSRPLAPCTLQLTPTSADCFLPRAMPPYIPHPPHNPYSAECRPCPHSRATQPLPLLSASFRLPLTSPRIIICCYRCCMLFRFGATCTAMSSELWISAHTWTSLGCRLVTGVRRLVTGVQVSPHLLRTPPPTFRETLFCYVSTKSTHPPAPGMSAPTCTPF